MKKFSTIEKKFNSKLEKLNNEMSIALASYLNERDCSLYFDTAIQFTKDNGKIIFIERIFSDYFSSVWIRYRIKDNLLVKNFNDEFTLNEKQKLFQMLSNLSNIY